jgi:O-antigen ligase
MFAVAIPILFVTYSKIFPLSLLRSFEIIFLAIVMLIFNKNVFPTMRNKAALYFLLAFVSGYFLTESIRGNFDNSFLLGISGRNQGILFWIAMLIIYVLTSTNCISIGNLRKFGLFPLVILIMLVGVLQVLGWDYYSKNDQIELTLQNSNFAASILALATIVVLNEIIRFKSTYETIVLLAVTAVLIGLGLKTGALQYPVLSVFGLTVMMIFHFYHGLKARLISKWKYTLPVTILAGAPFAWLAFHSLLAIPSTIDRIDMFKIGLKVWKDNPILGVGIENLLHYSPEYRTVRQVKLLGSNIIVDKSHNSVLDHFASGGILAGLGYLLFIITISLCLFRLLRIPKSDSRNRDISLLAAIWFTWMVHTLLSTDFSLFTLIAFVTAGCVTYVYGQDIAFLSNKTLHTKKTFGTAIKIIASVNLIIALVFANEVLDNYSKINKIVNGKSMQFEDIEKILVTLSDSKISEDVISILLENPKNCEFSEKLLSILFVQNKRSDKFYYWSAYCFAIKGEKLEALDQVERALLYYPNSLDYQVTYFQLAKDLNLKIEATASLRKIRLIDPANPLITKYSEML